MEENENRYSCTSPIGTSILSLSVIRGRVADAESAARPASGHEALEVKAAHYIHVVAL